MQAEVLLSKAQDAEKLVEYFLTSQCDMDRWCITLICSFNVNLVRRHRYSLPTGWKPFFAPADCLLNQWRCSMWAGSQHQAEGHNRVLITKLNEGPPSPNTESQLQISLNVCVILRVLSRVQHCLFRGCLFQMHRSSIMKWRMINRG